MNDLSWLIYLADIVSGINGFLAAITVGSVLWIAGAIIYGMILKDGWNVKVGDEVWTRGHQIQKAAATKTIWVPLIAILVAIPIPSKTTIYAIAASEGGEAVLKSETAGKAMEALNAWLDRQIKGEAE